MPPPSWKVTEEGDLACGRLGHYCFILRSFKRIKTRSGVREDLRFHDLRHTCATLLLREGVNAKVVSEMLGHASITITLNTYSHVLPDMQDSAADAMEVVLGTAW
jgi:integrase